MIADTANGLNQGAIITQIHFAPKIVDIDIDDIRHVVYVKLPDLLENRGAGNGLPGVAHEKFKQRIFLATCCGCGDKHRVPSAKCQRPPGSYAERPLGQTAGLLRFRSSLEGLTDKGALCSGI